MGTMLLRFRPHFFAHIALLAFGALACEAPLLLARQDSTESKPNSLRIGDPKGLPKSSAPSNFGRSSSLVPLDLPATSPIQPQALPIESAFANEPKGDKLLLVGTLSTQIAKSTPSSQIGQTAMDSLDRDDLAKLELGLKIASASLSHVTPFMWLMAGPTSNLFVDYSKEVESAESESLESESIESKFIETEPSDQIAMALEDDTLEATASDEPPRLIPATNTGFSSLLPTEEDSDDEIPETKAPVAISKPTPRTVRIPFEKKMDEPSSDSIGLEVLPKIEVQPKKERRDRESQKDQEEPKLVGKEETNGREDQGVDALKASKPIINRREIQIEDPTNQGIPVAPIVPSSPADPVLAKRLQRTEACLSHYLNNPESTSVRSPWAVMHALLAFGGEYELVHNQGRVNAIGWMCHNGTCRTQRMFTPTSRGFTPNVGDGVQGHEGQFLAILAQSNVPLNYPIQIGTSKFTVEDLVRHEMSTCKEKSELTFKLIGLSYYLDSNKQWRANDGKQWSIQKLIQEELAQPIVGAACGGVHRLMGFSFSVRQRQLQGQPVTGQYARAAKFVREYIDYTWQLQNPDGSFSTSWYEGRANEPNEERKVQTTGHMLEWLMYTLSEDEINTARVGKSIDFLLSKIYDKREHKWPIGPRGHATRAIALYQDRIQEAKSKPSTNAQVKSATKAGSGSKAVRK